MNLTKPSRLARDVSKWETRVKRERAKDRDKRQAANKWTAISALVKSRDGGCCRVCHRTTTKAGTGNPNLWGAAHHIVYKSAGGPDALWNLIWVDAECHDREHVNKTINITGTASALSIEPGPLATHQDCEWLRSVTRGDA